jgi:hypothetical protein
VSVPKVAQDVHLRPDEPSRDATMDRPDGASLLFVNQHYAPDVAATGQCLADLAEYLVDVGYHVDVLAGHTRYDAGQVEAPARETRNGVRVRRVATTHFGRRTNLGRVVDYASFYLAVLARLLFGRRYDGVVFLTTPPLIALAQARAFAASATGSGRWIFTPGRDRRGHAGRTFRRRTRIRVARCTRGRGADVVDLAPHARPRVAEGRPRILHGEHWGGRLELPPQRRQSLTRRLGSKAVRVMARAAGIVHDFGAIFRQCGLRDDPGSSSCSSATAASRGRTFASRGASTTLRIAIISRVSSLFTIADVHLISLRPQFVWHLGAEQAVRGHGVGATRSFVGPMVPSGDLRREVRCGVVIDPTETGTRLPAGRSRTCCGPGPCDQREELGARERAFVERYDHRLSCSAFENIVRSVWAAPSRKEQDAACIEVRANSLLAARGSTRS